MAYNKETGMYEGYIYIITNSINDNKYIGQTTQTINRRWQQHLCDSKRKSKKLPLYRAMHKYGSDYFTIEQLCKIEETTQKHVYEKLNDLEVKYISYYDSYDNGYNMTEGGYAHLNGRIKSVYQYNLDGSFITEYYSISCAANELGISDSSLSGACRGVYKNIGGYQWSFEKHDKIDPYFKNSIMIDVYDRDKNFINTFDSVLKTAKFINVNTAQIYSVLKGLSTTAKGYFCVYSGEIIPDKRFNNTHKVKNDGWDGNKKRVDQYTIGGSYIASFNSIAEASKSVGLNTSGSISNCLKGKTKTSKSYIWKYAT